MEKHDDEKVVEDWSSNALAHALHSETFWLAQLAFLRLHIFKTAVYNLLVAAEYEEVLMPQLIRKLTKLPA